MRRILIALALATLGASACDKKQEQDARRDDKKDEARPTSPEPQSEAPPHEGRPPPSQGGRGGGGGALDEPPLEGEVEGGVIGGVGGEALGGPVTSEVTLLRYQHWSDAPEFCRTPTKLLAHLDDALSSDDCEAQRVSLHGREQLLLSCFSEVEAAPASTGASGDCEVEYAGTLRVLRASSSETDYTLVGQGNLSRVCKTSDERVRASAAELDDVRAQRQAARRLEQELQACRQP